MAYFDAHLHIIPDEEFLKANDAGVRTFIVNSARQSDWQKVVEIPSRVLGVWTGVGVHPWYINDVTPDWRFQLEDMLRQNPLALVGETGLDAGKSHFEEQERFFIEHLKLAQKYNRQVVIHCVRAWPHMLDILREFKDMKLLFHRFSGDENVVQKLRFMDAYFSVMNDARLDVIPDNRILVESDAPDGLKSPAMIPELVRNLGLNPIVLRRNLEMFLNVG